MSLPLTRPPRPEILLTSGYQFLYSLLLVTPDLLRLLGESLRGSSHSESQTAICPQPPPNPHLMFIAASGNYFADYKHIIFQVSIQTPAHLNTVHPPSSPEEIAHKPSVEVCPLP